MKRNVITRDGRKELWQGNALLAYVDPDDDWLCIIGPSGHVVARPDMIYHESQILKVYDEYTKANPVG